MHVYDFLIEDGMEQVSKVLDLQHELLGCNWLVGKSFKREGIFYADDVPDASFGRSYDNTACVLYPWCLSKPNLGPVVCVPCAGRAYNPYTREWIDDNCIPWVLVHELGHVLHWHLGLEDFGFETVTEYATYDYMESFAEAFTSWIFPDYVGWGKKALPPCEKARTLFDGLGILIVL